jgi:hypothetical protein
MRANPCRSSSGVSVCDEVCVSSWSSPPNRWSPMNRIVYSSPPLPVRCEVTSTWMSASSRMRTQSTNVISVRR